MAIRVPGLVLIAQAVFLSERGQTDGQTDATERPTHSGGYIGLQPAWVIASGQSDLARGRRLRFTSPKGVKRCFREQNGHKLSR